MFGKLKRRNKIERKKLKDKDLDNQRRKSRERSVKTDEKGRGGITEKNIITAIWTGSGCFSKENKLRIWSTSSKDNSIMHPLFICHSFLSSLSLAESPWLFQLLLLVASVSLVDIVMFWWWAINIRTSVMELFHARVFRSSTIIFERILFWCWPIKMLFSLYGDISRAK